MAAATTTTTTTRAGEGGAHPDTVTWHWRWWTIVLRGIAAVAFGVLSLFAPKTAYLSLVVLFGIYALVDGVLALSLGIRHRGYPGSAIVLRGIVSLIAGLLALFWPGFTGYAFLVLIACWAIVAGILELVMAIRLRKAISHEWLLGLEGALSLAFGILLLIAPLAGAIVLGLWIGAYALVFGGMQIESGLRLRARAHVHPPGAAAAA